MNDPVIDGIGAFLADQLSRYKHPESYEIVDVSPRDDSGKVRRTLLRDETRRLAERGARLPDRAVAGVESR